MTEKNQDVWKKWTKSTTNNGTQTHTHNQDENTVLEYKREDCVERIDDDNHNEDTDGIAESDH